MKIEATIVDGRILAKAGPIKGRPGLVLAPSKKNPRQKRWQKTGEQPTTKKRKERTTERGMRIVRVPLKIINKILAASSDRDAWKVVWNHFDGSPMLPTLRGGIDHFERTKTAFYVVDRGVNDKTNSFVVKAESTK